MKKYAFVLLAGSIIGLSACGNDANTNNQAQIDSAANARTAELEAAHQAQTDSILNEMARMKADSTAMADSLAKAANTTSTTVSRTTTTTKTTKPAKPAAPKPTTPQQEQKDKFDSRETGSNTISEEKKQEQKSKFDRRGGGGN